ncbi:hypothetical protein BDA96_07G156500 [Sorghum bicolor]|uniref:DUF761 domain-containing protein n=2 Tax=Sorghum bicolor TaxID=4558 RepID=A0A921UA19_SORBI|nr:uncharacterized protein LOC8080632 [Sorghum bicolor]EES13938.1 hypothetical protein SORBI_3007G145700 [Sorghum bicolor]KAG0523828.1 hypothetical protein BDA96_07G156500 [Sorghum bicolor]|eukprot:XP_002444443.1 uncharacterized protein LOC8080632 [Sorghum bicolor]
MEEETPKAKKRSSVLGSLREAIAKVRFLLSFSATRWMLLRSLAGRARRLSFDSRPGLLDVEDSIIASPASSSSSSSSRITSRSASLGTATTRSLSRTSSAATASPEALKRASSSSGGASPAAGDDDDDIDQRAELFIANFYRQLRMERQVSLQLRYVRGNSWDRTLAASPSPSRGG